MNIEQLLGDRAALGDKIKGGFTGVARSLGDSIDKALEEGAIEKNVDRGVSKAYDIGQSISDFASEEGKAVRNLGLLGGGIGMMYPNKKRDRKRATLRDRLRSGGIGGLIGIGLGGAFNAGRNKDLIDEQGASIKQILSKVLGLEGSETE